MENTKEGKLEFKRNINRQRLAPGLRDYSYPVLRANLDAFLFFREQLPAGPGLRVLDIGCGFKPWKELLAASGADYVGVDPDPGCSDADLAGSAAALPFGDGVFDAVICSEVLEHVEDVRKALSEIRRVSRDGALVYITTPFMFPNHGLPHDYQRLTRQFYEKAFSGDEILRFRESNSSAATVFLSVNLFIESTPFAALRGLKDICFVLMNAGALLADLATEAAIWLLGERFRPAFYLMPVGYSLVARLRK